MRLTKNHKEAFVKAVMQDVPHVDYKEHARDRIKKLVADARKRAGVDKMDDERLDSCFVAFTNGKGYSEGTAIIARGLTVREVKEIQNDAQARALIDKHNEQKTARTELEAAVRAAIAGCTTRQQAKKLMPEFEKYLPTEHSTGIDRSVPAIANMAAKLTAAGWPKNAAQNTCTL